MGFSRLCSLFSPYGRSAGWFSPAAYTEGSSNTFIKGCPSSLLTAPHKGPHPHILNQACKVSSWVMDSLDPMQSPPAACYCGSWESRRCRDLGSFSISKTHSLPESLAGDGSGKRLPEPFARHGSLWTTGGPELSSLCTVSVPDSGLEGWQMGLSKTPAGLGV